MELRQLRYFIAVAEELHFGRAAEKLYIAQPPLSQQIKKLEEEMGVLLFDRSNRRVRLTPEGRKFLCVARNTLENLSCGVEQVKRMARGEIGRLRVGFINSASQSKLPGVVAEFRRLHPGITLDIREMHSHLQRAAVLEGELDAGLVHSCCANMAGFDWLTFLSEEYVLAVHEDHPIARQESSRDEDLHGEDLIMFPREFYPASYDKTIARFHNKGIQPNIVQEAGTHQTKLALISAGMGVGFVPQRMQRACPPGVRLIPHLWGEHKGTSDVKLIWRDGEVPPALACFIEVMKAHCQEGKTCHICG
ncbi:LysR family transcriptional regulator [Salidesulfovibrio onnuriiensis]|uniref:LysR family transcriptional regulator n=1 Tax=Salidesulfovibrio onnuriiensis TaxID=2583823 RepID=UPI0011C9E1AC|nr:LysR family transcriptional regulator [Salidesulfovibrio onnuriiensis]